MIDGIAGGWHRLDSARRYEGYTVIRRDSYRLPDGSVSGWDVLEEGPTVAVVAFTDTLDVVVFDQYRVGPARILTELPGGLVDAGEDPTSAGIRELREETGYTAAACLLVGGEWSAANSTRRKHVVIATGCRSVGEPTWDAGESGRVHEISAATLLTHLLSGELTDAGVALRGLLTFAVADDIPRPMRDAQRAVVDLLAPPPR